MYSHYIWIYQYMAKFDLKLPWMKLEVISVLDGSMIV